MRHSLLFFTFLLLLSCMGQLASDIYLPAMPAIKMSFNTSAHFVQLSLSLFMFGYAFSHLIYGPISDGVGRKNPLLVGTFICIIGTVICQFAHNINLFILGRFLQGAGAGASATLFRSILRDIYSGDKLAKIGSILAISRVIILASAPLMGGYILHFFGWRACFTFILIFISICFLAAVFILKETNRYKERGHLRLNQIMKNSKMLLTNGIFMGNSFCVLLAFGGILAWLTSLPFLLQNVVGLTPVQFGWVSAIAGLFFIIGGLVNALLVERKGLYYMLKVGLLIMAIGSLVMLGFGMTGHINAWVIMIPVIIYIIGSSMIFANAYAGAFHPFPKIAGTAGAIFGFLQILGGALSSALMSFMKTYNQVPLAIVLLASAIIAYVIISALTKGRNLDHDSQQIQNASV